MTIINWYTPLDKWVIPKLSKDIEEFPNKPYSVARRVIATALAIILDNPDKLRFPESLSLDALEYLIVRYMEQKPFLADYVRETDNLIFDCTDRDIYSRAVCQFMIRAALAARDFINEEIPKKDNPTYIQILSYLETKAGLNGKS